MEENTWYQLLNYRSVNYIYANLKDDVTYETDYINNGFYRSLGVIIVLLLSDNLLGVHKIQKVKF